jgi:nucleoside-diphosphate-sugar epimerase
MRVLVTGANGFVGRAVAQHLQRLPGMAVVCSMRQAGLWGDISGVRMVSGDLGQAADWSDALAGVDAIVHAAARVHVMQDTAVDPLAQFRAINVQGTLNLAHQAARAGVRRFVFISSVKVNGEATLPGRSFTEDDRPAPQDAYGLSKWEAEESLRALCSQTGITLVIIRPVLVYGPGVRANFAALMRAVQRGWPLPLGAVHNRRSLVGLDNLVDLITLGLTHPQAAGQTFFASDGHDLSTAELVQGLARAAGVPVRLWPVPVPMLRLVAALLGKSDQAQRLCGNLQVDIGKARQLLNWQPPVRVDEGLRRAVAGIFKS